VTNYGGRFIYLEILEKEWPELIDDLCNRCILEFRKAILASDQREPDSFVTLCSYPGAEECAGQLRVWAAESNLHDEWMLDAAVQTLRYMAAPRPTRWVYIAPDLPLPTLEMKFEAVWIPAMMDGLAHTQEGPDTKTSCET
jgi:hypothetical protein